MVEEYSVQLVKLIITYCIEEGPFYYLAIYLARINSATSLDHEEYYVYTLNLDHQRPNEWFSFSSSKVKYDSLMRISESCGMYIVNLYILV